MFYVISSCMDDTYIAEFEYAEGAEKEITKVLNDEDLNLVKVIRGAELEHKITSTVKVNSIKLDI